MGSLNLPSRVKINTILDPYNLVIHYRRGFRVLNEMSKLKLKILALGNKYEPGFNWAGNFPSIDKRGGVNTNHSSTSSHSSDAAARAAVKAVSAGTFKNPGRYRFGDSSNGLDMITSNFIVNASNTYSMILCFDPVLYCKHLKGINLPVMTIARIRDINDYPEIIQITDYLMPYPSTKFQQGLQQLMFAKSVKEDSDND